MADNESPDAGMAFSCNQLLSKPNAPQLCDMFMDSYLEMHTRPHPTIPKNLQMADILIIWQSLVENVSLQA